MDIVNKRIGHTECSKQPSYGIDVSGKAEFCSGHAKDGMLDVATKRCSHIGCNKRPSIGVEGSGRTEFCSGHAKDDMIDLRKSRPGERGYRWAWRIVVGTRHHSPW